MGVGFEDLRVWVSLTMALGARGLPELEGIMITWGPSFTIVNRKFGDADKSWREFLEIPTAQEIVGDRVISHSVRPSHAAGSRNPPGSSPLPWRKPGFLQAAACHHVPSRESGNTSFYIKIEISCMQPSTRDSGHCLSQVGTLG